MFFTRVRTSSLTLGAKETLISMAQKRIIPYYYIYVIYEAKSYYLNPYL